MKTKNTHTTREGWLLAATDELRPHFADHGFTLPDKIRHALAFTSTGKRGRMAGECWHADSSGDQHFEIYIRPDKDDPLEVLAVLVHELIHTLLPPTVKHGKQFRDIALLVGLQGKMRQTTPTLLLMEKLKTIAANLGTLPHAKLNFTAASDVPKKQAKKWLKAECGASCGYSVRITSKWAKIGLPVCPVHPKNGPLVCDMPEDADDILLEQK
ncbi:MAG: transcription elongation protein SprT [Alphaproteobacteria bacterium]